MSDPDREPGSFSLEEVAAEFGVTRQRAHQLQINALSKLREGLIARGITEDVAHDILSAANRRETVWQRITRG